MHASRSLYSRRLFRRAVLLFLRDWCRLAGECRSSRPNEAREDRVGLRQRLLQDRRRHADAHRTRELRHPLALSRVRPYALASGWGRNRFAASRLSPNSRTSCRCATGCYFDAVESPTGQTPIADPEETQLNRAFLKYENKGETTPFTASVGRQRIIYDDARWVGNVGWRQNEQTFDSASASTSLGIEGLDARYGYLWDVKRIFGNDDDFNAGLGDFDSNSHIMSLGYQIPSGPKVAAFTYLLDLHNNAAGSVSNSSNSFGFRVNGAWDFAEDWKLDYVGSYAYQQDAKDNPVDYDAHYVWVSTMLGFAPLGSLGVGFEMLGSDNGLARVVTPLATAHKFNGFADVFLDNGGVTGLQDMFITVAPKLPWGLKMKLIYHRFWNDDTGGTLGNEIDGVVSKKLPYGFTVLSKGAYFDSTSSGRAQGRQTVWRWIFDVSYAF